MKKQFFLMTLTLSFLMLLAFSPFVNAQTQTADNYIVKSNNGNGILFWQSHHHKIHMGNTSHYNYGPVTGYSIKTNMQTHQGWGWTWGSLNQEPVAGLNSHGYFQVKGSITAENGFIAKGNLANKIRLTQGNYGIIKRHDGNNYWMLLTDKNDPNGTWNGLRPFRIILSTGSVHMGNNTLNVYQNGGGRVGIGTTSPDYKLDVNGTMRAKEVIVEEGWSDFVFEEDYDLPTLEEERLNIEAKGHLLGFESEEEMNGFIQMGDVTNRQQQKIEESVLHLIEHESEIQQLKKENELLKSKYESLEAMIIELQSKVKE